MKTIKQYSNLKIIFSSLVLVSLGLSSVDAQNTGNNDDNQKYKPFDYGQLIDESANASTKSYEETLYKVTIDTFEEGGNWAVNMPSDYGVAALLTKSGAPFKLKEQGEDAVRQVNPNQNPQNTAVAQDPNPATDSYFVNGPDPKANILGLRLNFFAGRKVSWLRINTITPVHLSGITKGLEVWVAGRNIKHRLYFVVEDATGKERLIDAGLLNFLGWRKVTAQIPSRILQEDYHNPERTGIVFKGFLLAFGLMDSFGKYYAYFDNLSAEVSRYKEENILADNPRDSW